MKNVEKVLFLGGLFPKETEKEIVEHSIGSVQNAANVLQWNLVRGLDENLPAPVKILNSLYIGSWPRRYKKAIIPSYEFSHAPEAKDKNVGFWNITFLKQLFRSSTLSRAVRREIASEPDLSCAVIAYAMTRPMLRALRAAKRRDPRVTTCLVIPDLPEFMNVGTKRSVLERFLKARDMKTQRRDLSFVDCFVVLTEPMMEKLPAKPYVVMEGIAGAVPADDVLPRREKTVVYTGGLNASYGVVDLVEAFRAIPDPDYRLILCGAGDAVDTIRRAAEEDPRIDFRGLVPHGEIHAIQQSAAVLVNPRTPAGEFTRYSFPSKNLEYMASGTPTVAHRLPGIPSEYEGHLVFIPEPTVSSLKETIMKVCSLSPEESRLLGERAKTFVSREKNAARQAQKILDLLCGLTQKGN